MSTNARWIIGLLLALVIGLGVALLIVAGDDDGSDGSTVTLPPATGQTQPTETTTTPTEPTEPTTTDDSGGVAPPED